MFSASSQYLMLQGLTYWEFRYPDDSEASAKLRHSMSCNAERHDHDSKVCANFRAAVFNDGAEFDYATFCVPACFYKTTWYEATTFLQCQFHVKGKIRKQRARPAKQTSSTFLMPRSLDPLNSISHSGPQIGARPLPIFQFEVPRQIRIQLQLYWLVSGYGERVLRPIWWFLLIGFLEPFLTPVVIK